MRTEYFIAMDAHCRTTDVCIKTRGGKLIRREHLDTGIPQLRELIDSIPRPRRLCFEESSMAGWLYRNLKDHADELIVCNPRRNALVAKEGDKDDPIDAEKLNDLYRGGYLKAVHQLDCVEKVTVKQIVGLYHDRVAHRIAEGNYLLALGKRWGVMLRRSRLLKEDGESHLRTMLKDADTPLAIMELAEVLRQGLLAATVAEDSLRQRIHRIVGADKMMSRVAELPGYGPIRAATLISYLDTPWRFKGKTALWKYVGIGLCRERSGDGATVVKVEQQCNRRLRNVTIGAARAAIAQKENVFARRYARWKAAGISPRNARRNVARDQVTAVWGMWKSDRAFDAKLICDSSDEE